MTTQEHSDDSRKMTRSKTREEVADWLDILRNPDSSELPAHPSFLFFRHAGRELALPAVCIGSVGTVGYTHRVPHRHGPLLKGLAAADGELVPLIELASAIGLDTNHQEVNRVPRLLILSPPDSSESSWAIIVDKVYGVEMSDPSSWSNDTSSPFITSEVETPRGPAHVIDTAALLDTMEAVFQ